MIELRDFRRSDFQQLIDWIDTPEFMLQWGGSEFHFPLSEKQLEKYLENANNNHSDKLIYSVVAEETQQVVGHISLGKIDQKNKSARIGRVLVGDKKVRGRGVGEQMMKEVVRISFDELKMHRVSLGVFDFNKPAIACYEKVGFVKEGVLREARKMHDEYWNLVEMSMLETEWHESLNKVRKNDEKSGSSLL